jgi:hypothetical protein
MNTDEEIVEIAGIKVLIYRDGEDWFWRGADWTSHRSSFGAFATREQAIAGARKHLEPDNLDGGIGRRPR